MLVPTAGLQQYNTHERQQEKDDDEERGGEECAPASTSASKQTHPELSPLNIQTVSAALRLQSYLNANQFISKNIIMVSEQFTVNQSNTQMGRGH